MRSQLTLKAEQYVESFEMVVCRNFGDHAFSLDTAEEGTRQKPGKSARGTSRGDFEDFIHLDKILRDSIRADGDKILSIDYSSLGSILLEFVNTISVALVSGARVWCLFSEANILIHLHIYL